MIEELKKQLKELQEELNALNIAYVYTEIGSAEEEEIERKLQANYMKRRETNEQIDELEDKEWGD